MSMSMGIGSSALSSESQPLLPPTTPKLARISRWNATPTKLVPFVLIASVARGLSLAPRLDVISELACSAVRHEHIVRQSPLHVLESSILLPMLHSEHPAAPLPLLIPEITNTCREDPAVQSVAAELQTIMNLTFGILSAFTCGFWGSLGDRIGRTWVLCLVAFGFLSQDLVYVLCANFSRALHLGHYTLIIGPIMEGLLGSWPCFFALVNAYVSDCSPPGSRAKLYAYFSGLFFAGVSLGPALASFAIRRLDFAPFSLFYLAIGANAFNILFALVLLPESLQPGIRKQGLQTTTASGSNNEIDTSHPAARKLASPRWFIRAFNASTSFLHPLRLLAPHQNHLGDGSSTSKWDFDLTLLGTALFLNFLCNGIVPNKYMYGEFRFGWNAADLGEYVTIIASCRALWLLVVLPFVIKTFKPKYDAAAVQQASQSAGSITPAQRRALLLPAISFDLRLARISVAIDSLSYFATCFANSGLTYTISTTLSAFGGGMPPASQSIMISLMADGAALAEGSEDVGAGAMFGAISMLQAGGQTILGPLMFGYLYAETVQNFSSAIFVLGGTLLFGSLLSLLFVAPYRKITPQLRNIAARTSFTSSGRSAARRKRGRSRTAKDLRRSSDISSQFGGSGTDIET